MLEAAAELLVEELMKASYGRLHNMVRARRTRVRTSVNGVSRDLAALRATEFVHTPESSWAAAVVAVDDLVAGARDLELSAVVDAQADADELERRLRRHGAPVLARAALDPEARAVADRLIDELCHRVVGVVVDDPSFVPRGIQKLMNQVDDLRQRLVDQTAAAAPPAEQSFEDRYRAYLAVAFDSTDLYGIGMLPRGRRQSVLATYVQLAVTRSRVAVDPDTDLTGAGLPAGPTLSAERRALVRGSAGSGKSTLLRRWVVAAALGEQEWCPSGVASVPFLVELRRYVGRPLPATATLAGCTAPPLAGAEPARWVDTVMTEGRGLVLVDGLDEVEPVEREAVRTWVANLCLAYPRSRVVLTTRRSTIPEGWLDDVGFAGYDLQPMTRESTETFIGRWHSAYVTTAEADEEQQEIYEQRRVRLLQALERRSELRAMAAAPLLCGLICVLNHHYNAPLPARRADLYRSALRLLLVEWDEARDVRQDEKPLLDRDERQVLLERLAHALIVDERDDIERSRALQRIAAETRGMASRPRARDGGPQDEERVAAWSAAVLDWVLERSSVLREPVPGIIEFSHNSFRDYLAAREFVNRAQIPLLIERAHHVRWRDVVIMAMSSARPEERVQLLRGLLSGNEASARDASLRPQLQLVAAACLRESPSILEQDSGDVTRDEVLAMLRRWIPPTDRDEAELLARAGRVVIDLLPGPDELDPRHAPFVARTLAMIGGPEALARLAEFGPSRNADVADDLLYAWRSADDPAEYARTVLADVDFGDRPVSVRSAARIRHLVHLRGARVVACVGTGDPVTTVAAMPAVHTLSVHRNVALRSLEALRGNTTLRSLTLSACDVVRDLSALVDTQVVELRVTNCVRADLASVAGAPLRSLRIGGGRHDDLSRITPELPHLERLEIGDEPARRTLAGLDRWPTLTRLVLRGLAPAEVDAVARVPPAAVVTVEQVGPEDADAVRRLAGLGVTASLTVPGDGP